MYKNTIVKALCAILACACLSAAQVERDAAAETAVIEDLKKVAPDAVPTFVSATEALDSSNFTEAQRLYQDVLKRAPEFEPALRRLGYTYVALGKRKEGQDLTQRALSKSRSVDNLVGRASSLISTSDPNYRPTQAEIMEALSLAKEAWQKSGETDEDSAVIVAETLLMSNQMTEFEKFAPTVKRAFPDSAMSSYYYAIALANQGDFDAAEAEIRKSEELGASPDASAPLLAAINTARDEAFFGFGRYLKYGYIALALIAVWAVGLVALFVAGRYLSAKTMKSIEEADPNDITDSAHASLKKTYRWVISIAGIYYYISQPVVIFLVVAVTLGVIVFFMWVGTIPVKLLLIFAFVGALSIFYIVKSLITRVKVEDPGRALTEAEAPELWRMVRSVAAIIKTRPVNEIRITPGTDLAVYERGSFRAKISDNAERILIIGTAVLKDFDQNAFRAVLAHEYGHFSNRDTAGGDIAYRVNTDIIRVAESMGASGTATFYNLGFQFLRLFHFLFRRITHGASRLQEVLADRVAAFHFGTHAFKDGLSHVIRREIEFSRLADNEISSALGSNRAIQNLYEISVNDESEKKEIDEAFKGVLDLPTSEDDTHPSAQDRFRYIENIRSAEVDRLTGNVWDLFADRSAITAEMNALVEKLVRPDHSASSSVLGI